MAVFTPSAIKSTFDGDEIFRLSVEQYHALIEAGILTTDDRVELLEGVLLYKRSIYPPHSGTVRTVRENLSPRLPAGWRYRSEQPIVLSDGEPEPDGVIARGTPADDFTFHPPARDVAVVIELADTTLKRDRTIKLRSYARDGIQVYWIVNLIDRQIEVNADPDSTALPEPTYRSRDIYTGDTAVPLVIAGELLASIPTSSLLPPV